MVSTRVVLNQSNKVLTGDGCDVNTHSGLLQSGMRATIGCFSSKRPLESTASLHWENIEQNPLIVQSSRAGGKAERTNVCQEVLQNEAQTSWFGHELRSLTQSREMCSLLTKWQHVSHFLGHCGLYYELWTPIPSRHSRHRQDARSRTWHEKNFSPPNAMDPFTAFENLFWKYVKMSESDVFTCRISTFFFTLPK